MPLLPLDPTFFSIILFLVHHPANWDDQHLLAREMASDFTAACKDRVYKCSLVTRWGDYL
jgi:hypothetical protein